MPLTPEEKAERKRKRMIAKAREDSIGTYAGKVAVVFQKMVRANAGALPAGMIYVVVDGEVSRVYRRVGQCACITCGKVLAWSAGKRMQTGHFDHGRSTAALLFEERGVAPQCAWCNNQRGGADRDYTLWMLAVRGKAVERLAKLKKTDRRFTFEELVDMKIEYAARLKAAIERIGGDT